jgi:hypothetical protein
MHMRYWPSGTRRRAVKSEVYLNEELERDRPSAVVADLRQVYRAFDQLRELASQAGTEVVAGHDPAVFSRFPGRGGTGHVIQIAALD